MAQQKRKISENRTKQSIEKYLEEIGGYSPLPPEDEVRLAREIRRNNPRALDQLVKANLRFVISVAKEYQGKDVLKERIRTSLPGSPGVFATVKQPTLFDELSNMKSLMSRPGSTLELITETLIIESFEQEVEEKAEPVIYSDRVDVIDAYLSLPAKDKS